MLFLKKKCANRRVKNESEYEVNLGRERIFSSSLRFHILTSQPHLILLATNSPCLKPTRRARALETSLGRNSKIVLVLKKWFMSTLVVNFNYFRAHALDFKTYGRKARKWKHFVYKFYILVILLFSTRHQRWRFLNIQMKGAWWSASTYLCICFHNCNRAFLKNRLTVVTCPGVPPSSCHQFH